MSIMHYVDQYLCCRCCSYCFVVAVLDYCAVLDHGDVVFAVAVFVIIIILFVDINSSFVSIKINYRKMMMASKYIEICKKPKTEIVI